jgi:hypothetical protein
MSLTTTVEYASLASEALSQRLALVPAEFPDQQGAPLSDEFLETQDNHVGGCLRGVLFALVFQSAAITFCMFLFAMWRMNRQ